MEASDNMEEETAKLALHVFGLSVVDHHVFSSETLELATGIYCETS